MNRAIIVMIALLGGCESSGTSTEEIKAAAIEKARQQFNLGADAALEATAWTGQEYEGELSLCGTVSGDGAQMPPQRFLATTDPVEWQIFEPAHGPMPRPDLESYPAWEQYCGNPGQAPDDEV